MFFHQRPEARLVIEFLQMTQFVKDYVILQTLGKKLYLVAEIEVLKRSTTSPAMARVANSHTVVCIVIKLVPVQKPLVYQNTRDLFVRHIMFGNTGRTPSSSSYNSPFHNEADQYNKRRPEGRLFA